MYVCSCRGQRNTSSRTAGPSCCAPPGRMTFPRSPRCSRNCRPSLSAAGSTAHAGPALLARLARIAPPGTVSIVAAPADDPGHLAAEARYVPAGADVAELGNPAVLDSYQGTGLGHLLLGELVERARESGLARLQAVVNLTNGPMLHLLEPYGRVLTAPTDLSVVSLEISAAGGMPGPPADAPGQRVLVEQRSWFDGDRVAALRSAGNVVRVCLGPEVRLGGAARSSCRAPAGWQRKPTSSFRCCRARKRTAPLFSTRTSGSGVTG